MHFDSGSKPKTNMKNILQNQLGILGCFQKYSRLEDIVLEFSVSVKKIIIRHDKKYDHAIEEFLKKTMSI